MLYSFITRIENVYLYYVYKCIVVLCLVVLLI